jgi:small subunit ribosomal protein S8
MTMSDPVADMFTRIRNAQSAGKSKTECPYSTLKGQILDLLTKEGYIRGYKINEDASHFKVASIELKYVEGRAAIQGIKRSSKPGRRLYAKTDALPKVRSGLGVVILSTSKGVMTGQDAMNHNVGGEVLGEVF